MKLPMKTKIPSDVVGSPCRAGPGCPGGRTVLRGTARGARERPLRDHAANVVGLAGRAVARRRGERRAMRGARARVARTAPWDLGDAEDGRHADGRRARAGLRVVVHRRDPHRVGAGRHGRAHREGRGSPCRRPRSRRDARERDAPGRRHRRHGVDRERRHRSPSVSVAETDAVAAVLLRRGDHRRAGHRHGRVARAAARAEAVEGVGREAVPLHGGSKASPPFASAVRDAALRGARCFGRARQPGPHSVPGRAPTCPIAVEQAVVPLRSGRPSSPLTNPSRSSGPRRRGCGSARDWARTKPSPSATVPVRSTVSPAVVGR